MLHPEMKKVLQEISAQLGPGYENDAKDNPDACLLSILLTVKERLPEVWAMLGITIQMSFSENYLEEAQRLLGQTKSKPDPKAEKKSIKAR